MADLSAVKTFERGPHRQNTKTSDVEIQLWQRRSLMLKMRRCLQVSPTCWMSHVAQDANPTQRVPGRSHLQERLSKACSARTLRSQCHTYDLGDVSFQCSYQSQSPILWSLAAWKRPRLQPGIYHHRSMWDMNMISGVLGSIKTLFVCSLLGCKWWWQPLQGKQCPLILGLPQLMYFHDYSVQLLSLMWAIYHFMNL